MTNTTRIMDYDVFALTEKDAKDDGVKTTALSRVASDKTAVSGLSQFDDIDEAAVLRKIDWHLLPICSVLYLLAYLDRGAIGNAKIEGLTDSLGLSTNQYNVCLTIFFITYASFEIPSNMLLRKLGKPSVFLPTIMVCWGVIMTCMGLVRNFGGLFATRLLLGVFEAGLYPGMSFGLTMYYNRREMLSRQAQFYSAASLAGAFSGLLAFAIAKMDGAGGYEGWRWIFILEGIATVVVAVAAFWLMPNYPRNSKFLTEREKEYVIWRLSMDEYRMPESDTSTVGGPDFVQFTEKDDISITQALKEVFKDWQAYLQVLLTLGAIAPTYGIALFLPSVVKGLGYTSSTAQLLTIPIYIFASGVSVVMAFASDRWSNRSLFIGGELLAVMIGFAIAIGGQCYDENGVIYAGVFIAVAGLYSAFPSCVSWFSNNLANSRKRAVGMAFQIGFGNFGGAMASNFYKPDGYLLGHSLELGFVWMGFIACVVSAVAYNRINKKREQELQEGKWAELSERELFQKGDKSPYFRYQL